MATRGHAKNSDVAFSIGSTVMKILRLISEEIKDVNKEIR